MLVRNEMDTGCYMVLKCEIASACSNIWRKWTAQHAINRMKCFLSFQLVLIIVGQERVESTQKLTEL